MSVFHKLFWEWMLSVRPSLEWEKQLCLSSPPCSNWNQSTDKLVSHYLLLNCMDFLLINIVIDDFNSVSTRSYLHFSTVNTIM